MAIKTISFALRPKFIFLNIVIIKFSLLVQSTLKSYGQIKCHYSLKINCAISAFMRLQNPLPQISKLVNAYWSISCKYKKVNVLLTT